ncbi:MAG: caspase family protein [Dehalococcoidia bacterium]|nr:MAG: caspase family protein [Dehalococcoidia bacterium]
MIRKLIVVSVALCLILVPLFSGITMAAPEHQKNTSQNITIVTPQGKIEIAKKVGLGEWPLYSVESWGPKPQAARGRLGEALPEGGERYAVAAGISDYPGIELDIYYAADDAVAMSYILVDLYGFDEVQCFVDEDATRDNILGAIEDVKEMANENDEVVFFFSGHGAKLTPHFGQGQVGIVTWGQVEPEFIWDRELKRAFEGLETDRVAFIFDCCLAGGMIDLAKTGRIIGMASTQNGYAVEYGEVYGPPIEIPGIEEPTFINHGLFTYFFAVCGMQHRMADFYDHDGDPETQDVTFEEAFDLSRQYLIWIHDVVPEIWQISTIGDCFPNDMLP